MTPKGLQDIANSPRPNFVLLIVTAVLAVLCVILYLDRPVNDGLGSVGRKLWGPRVTRWRVAVTYLNHGQWTPEMPIGENCYSMHYGAPLSRSAASRPECANTIAPGEGCFDDSRVWATQMGQILGRALTHLTLEDDDGQRIYCETLTGTATDPPSVTVQQGGLYPPSYFSSVPKAEFFKDGYPVRLRVGSTDALVMKQFFCEPHFQFVSLLGPWLPKNRPTTVVDVGANIGLASILFSQLINFNGEVLSVEANPSTLEILEENVARLGEGVTVVGAALAPQHLAGGSVNFVGQEDQYWGFRVLPDEELRDGMTVHKVPTKSLADVKKLSKSGKIDFMKIDIEGYEKEIFPDKDSWPVLCEMRCIAAEVHDWFVPGCSAALNEFLENGCKDDPFRHIANTGEYSLYCRMKVLSEDW